MTKRWVVNAFPLIVLANVGQIDLLTALSDEWVLPREVADEIAAGPEGDAARRWHKREAAPIVEAPPAPMDLVAWDLGVGETTVLAYPLIHEGWTSAARRCTEGAGGD